MEKFHWDILKWEKQNYMADLYQDQDDNVWAKLPVKGNELPKIGR